MFRFLSVRFYVKLCRSLKEMFFFLFFYLNTKFLLFCIAYYIFKLKKNYMIFINLNFLLLITIFLFIVGLLGLILNKKNFLIVIVSIELLLLAINLNFVVFSVYLDDLVGQIFVLFILTIAATESAIGLAILILYYKINNKISIDFVKTKKS